MGQNLSRIAVNENEAETRSTPSFYERPIQKMFDELCEQGRLTKTRRGFQIQRPPIKFSYERRRLMGFLLDFANDRGFVSFNAGTFWQFHGRRFDFYEIKLLFDYLQRQNKLIRLKDGRFLTTKAVVEIKEKVKQHIIDKGSLTISDSKQILGFGRNRGIPILEYLDDIGFTSRRGNERVLITEREDGKKTNQELRCNGGLKNLGNGTNSKGGII